MEDAIMMENQQPQFQVKIDVEGILEKFDCPICMCKMTEPTITKCGHTFCKDCIYEAVNRTHDCPLCNGRIDNVQIETARNFALESVLKVFE